MSTGEKTERNTRQRRVILEELRRTNAHPTAVELYHLVRNRLPRISLGTVYRNLELLCRKGTVRRLSLGGSEARFDGCSTPHHHVRCAVCGRLDDVYDLPVDLSAEKFAELSGYEILDHHLEFVGHCPECRGN